MIRGAALALSIGTGFSGLVYEVSWQRYLATLLGSHAEATSGVLALFLGGLALGYAGFGAATRRYVAAAETASRPAHLLGMYGIVEIAIGVWGFLFPHLFRGVHELSVWLPGGAGGLGFALDLALSALLIAPPAIAMGATIPVLTQGLAHSLADATRFHALVYACNTAGAFVGALATGFWLIDTFGLIGSVRTAAAINVIAGSCFLLLDRAVGGDGSGLDAQREFAPPDTAPSPSSVQRLAAVAFLVGFAMMVVQTVWIRLGALAIGASEFTFAMVVAVFVLCIAIGSLAVSAFVRVPRLVLPTALWALGLLLAVLYLNGDDATYWGHVVRSLFVSEREAFYPYYVAVFLALLTTAGPAVLISGATLPLVFDRLRTESGTLGNVAGRIYAWNTIGSLAGALLGGYLLLIWLDLHAVFRLAVAAIVVAAALASVQSRGIARRAPAGALCAVALLALALLPAWSPDQLSAGLFRQEEATEYTYLGPTAFWNAPKSAEVLFHTDDPTATVAVKRIFAEGGSPEDIGIFTNGKADSSVYGDSTTLAMLALVPALLARNVESAFVVGWGTGATAGVLASLDSVREVVVAEISPGVIEAAPLFEDATRGASRSPKVEIRVQDALRALERTDERFDMIVSEPSNPWMAGVETLFSREFLQTSRDHLTRGGVHVQWMHVYEADRQTLEIVFRTYADVFDHVSVWYTTESDLLIVGLTDTASALDLDQMSQRVQRPDYSRALAGADIGNFAEFLAHELLPLGVVHAAELPGAIHTLMRPILGHSAARAFFVGTTAEMPVTSGPASRAAATETGLLDRLARRLGGELGDDVWAHVTAETCGYRARECLALLARWQNEVETSPRRAHLMQSLSGDERYLLNLVPLLASLQSPDTPYPTARNSPLAAARAASTLLELFYTHAAPISRESVVGLWDLCAGDPRVAETCESERRAFEARLGPLR